MHQVLTTLRSANSTLPGRYVQLHLARLIRETFSRILLTVRSSTILVMYLLTRLRES